jgi:hypothetical protein
MIWAKRQSGLLEQFDPPELSMEAAIDRGWRLRDDGRLLERKPEKFLPTYPLPIPWETVIPERPWGGPAGYFGQIWP